MSLMYFEMQKEMQVTDIRHLVDLVAEMIGNASFSR